MTKYLLSFASSAMVVPEPDFQAVSAAAHAVIEEAKVAVGREDRGGMPMRPGAAGVHVQPAVVKRAVDRRATMPA